MRIFFNVIASVGRQNDVYRPIKIQKSCIFKCNRSITDNLIFLNQQRGREKSQQKIGPETRVDLKWELAYKGDRLLTELPHPVHLNSAK